MGGSGRPGREGTGSGASFPGREQQGRSQGVCQGHGYWCLSGATMSGGQPSAFFYLEPWCFAELDASVIAAMAPCPPGVLRSRHCWHPRSHLCPPQRPQHPPGAVPEAWHQPNLQAPCGEGEHPAPNSSALPLGLPLGLGDLGRCGGPQVRGSWRGNSQSCREKGTSLLRREGL